MAKTHTIRPITFWHYLGWTLLACWAMFTTVLSHDRILYGVASYAAKQSQRVAAKYAPPVITKEVQVACKQPVAQAMPEPKDPWTISQNELLPPAHAMAILEKAR